MRVKGIAGASERVDLCSNGQLSNWSGFSPPILGVFNLRCFGALCLFIALSAPSSVLSQPLGVSVESFRVVKVSPESVDIELGGFNDGSLGDICLKVLAKSRDGSVRSVSASQVFMPVGKQLNVAAQVKRPSGRREQHTDYLMVVLSECRKDTLQGIKLNWQYVWEETPTKADSVLDDMGDQEEAYDNDPYWTILQNWEEEDYSALDLLLETWNDPKERDSNGKWKLDSFRSVFLNYSSQNANWKRDIERIQRWKKFNSKSVGAVIAEVKYWIAYAWHIRGCECNLSPDPVAIRVFGERMKRAENILKASKGFAASNPLWYEAYLDIAVSTKRSIIFTEKLFSEGVHMHPYFQPIYGQMAKYWSPRYEGKSDWEKVEAVVADAIARTAELDGTSNYSKIYMYVDNFQKLEFDLFQNSLAIWSRMRDSFEDLIKRYPGYGNLNEFAVYACRAGDKDTYLKLRVRIQDNILTNIWPSNYSLDICDHRFMQYS